MQSLSSLVSKSYLGRDRFEVGVKCFCGLSQLPGTVDGIPANQIEHHDIDDPLFIGRGIRAVPCAIFEAVAGVQKVVEVPEEVTKGHELAGEREREIFLWNFLTINCVQRLPHTKYSKVVIL